MEKKKMCWNPTDRYDDSQLEDLLLKIRQDLLELNVFVSADLENCII